MDQLIKLVERASRPGVLGLPGKALEKRCQRDLRAYFETLKGQVLVLKLEELVNQPAPQADEHLRFKVSRLLRLSSPALRTILEANLTRAFQIAADQKVIQESDEQRDDHGRWTSGGGTSSTKGETSSLKSKGLSIAGLAAVGFLVVTGLSGAKTLIGTPYSVMSCSQFACALTGRKHEWADKLYEEGKSGKVSDAKDGDIVAFNGSHVAVMTKDGLMDSIPERGVGFADLSKVSPADSWYQGPVRIIKGKPLGDVKEADDQPSTKPLDQLGVTGQDAVKFAEQRAGELITGLNQTTIDEIANTVAEGIEERIGVDGTSRLLRDLLDGMTKDRADLIATTEINGAMSEAALRKIKNLDIPYKRWIIADNDADDVCTGNEEDGPIPVDEAFSSGDYRPPAHPNCRCAVVGARAPEGV